jgi:hypothetical protein
MINPNCIFYKSFGNCLNEKIKKKYFIGRQCIEWVNEKNDICKFKIEHKKSLVLPPPPPRKIYTKLGRA